MSEPTDEVVGRLLRSAASLSQQQASRLADEVRQQVESEVRQLLHSAWKAALLQQIASELEQQQPAMTSEDRPATAGSSTLEPDEPLGLYTYGIVSSNHPPLPESTAAVDPAYPLQMLRHDGFQVITSNVTLREFSPEGWAERVTDLDWVEAKVRAHDQVLKQALEQGPLIPLRFGSIFYSADDLVSLLVANRDRLQETLRRLTGKQEWGVKIVRCARATDEMTPRHNGDGRAYMLEKQRQRQAKSGARDAAARIVQECHEKLSTAACEAIALPITQRAGAQRGEELLHNGSYLLDLSQVQPFHALIASLSEDYSEVGLSMETTGPWPPYDFVQLKLTPHGADEPLAS